MFSAKIFVFLLFVALASADCPTGAIYDQNFNKCYKFVSESVAFYLAEQECLSSGGHLSSVSSGVENALISEQAAATFGTNKQFWIGGSLLMSNSWTWTDGSAFNYTNWANGAPNGTGQCAEAQSSTGVWDAVACSTNLPFVCSIPNIVTTPPTVVTCPTPRPIPSHCESGWTYFTDTDSCYAVGFQKKWNDAETDCRSKGAHLTSLHSKGESDFVQNLAWTSYQQESNSDMTFIGLFRSGSSWNWTDGTQVDFINWQPKQPDNSHGDENCVQTFSDYLKSKDAEQTFQKWNDIVCTETMRTYVCKKSSSH